MKNGFTLIELLSVIVILAIISLIATPIVLGIIDDAKESAQIRSAEMYLSGVENSIAKENLEQEGNFKPTECSIISEGNLDCDDKEGILEVEVDGEKPKNGTITFEAGKIRKVRLEYENAIIVKNEEGNLVFEEEPEKEEKPEEKPKEDIEVVKTLDTICTYLNNGVVEKTAGAKYSCEVKEGTSYNFYVLTTPEEGSETINLIMERNICEDGTPTEAGKTCLVAYNSSGDASGTGPVTAMTYLNNATSSWENINNLNIAYDDEGGNFTGFVLSGKARMPYRSEITNYDSTNKTNAYLYDYLNLYNDIQKNSISGIYGYFTLSSVSSNSRDAFYASFRGYVDNTYVYSENFRYGVRAVINLKI